MYNLEMPANSCGFASGHCDGYTWKGAAAGFQPALVFLVSDNFFCSFVCFDKFCIWHSITTYNLVRELHVSDCLVVAIRMC